MVQEMPLIIRAVWYRRRSFNAALPFHPSRNFPRLRDAFRISCLLSNECERALPAAVRALLYKGKAY